MGYRHVEESEIAKSGVKGVSFCRPGIKKRYSGSKAMCVYKVTSPNFNIIEKLRNLNIYTEYYGAITKPTLKTHPR